MKLSPPIPLSIFFILSPLVLLCQIGTGIPPDRLPDGSATAWQDAGCPFLDEPVEVTALFNVIELGASGNGVDDDTEFIQQALALAGQQAGTGGFSLIYFPAGTYVNKEELVMPSRTVLKGDGADKSSLYFQHDLHAVIFNENEESGIEDIRMTRQTAQVLSKYFIVMSGCDNCWIRGVETEMANSNHVSLTECSHLLVTGCYFHECTDYGGGGNGYGIVLGNETVSSLIEDNIFRETRHAIVTGGLCHRNVAGYNASYDPHTSTSGGLGEWVTGDIELHGNSSSPGPQMGAYENLFEGNYFNWIWIDAYWGDNGDYNTFFRNIARHGGLVLEDHYESVNGGNHYDCNDSQNIVNNYFENIDIATKLRYGAPWGDGYLKSTNIGGSGHFARNNKVFEVVWPSLNLVTTWRLEGQEPEFLGDTSYYCAQKPSFIPAEDWPFDAFNVDSRNPAAVRYESGGPMTVTAGFSSYILTSIHETGSPGRFSVFPNPTSGLVTIRLTNVKLPGKVVVMDLLGKMLLESFPDGQIYHQLDLSGLKKGIYLIKIEGLQQIHTVIRY